MNKISRIALALALIFEILLLIKGIQALGGGKQIKGAGLPALAMATLTIPFLLTLLANRVKLKLPPGFQFVGVSFILLAQYFGEIKQFYQAFWWWDILLHGLFGLFAVLFAQYLLKSSLMKPPQISQTRFSLIIAILSATFSIACSALWEIFEYLGDLLFPVKMVKGGLEDSMSDLISGALVAFTTAACFFLWNLYKGKRAFKKAS